jgi:isopenicillin N synthase-like dioxygenase
VLTDIGEGEKLHRDMMADFAAFVAGSEDTKKLATSRKVYKNERNVPMWHCGYEGEMMREAFRVCTGQPNIDCWPSDQYRERWSALTTFLQDLCDRCLGALLEKEVKRPRDAEDDKSVAYAVFYPNNRGGQQEEGINIKQHYDPSLIVVEPIADAPGLEVFDRRSDSWLGVEAACEAGKEIIVFGGQALERATQGKVKAALHRVSAPDRARHVFILEQKYAEFFPPPPDWD